MLKKNFQRRAKIYDSGDQLKFVIPRRFNVLAIIIFLGIAGSLIYMQYLGFTQLFSSATTEFMFTWVFGSVVGGGGGLLFASWFLFGRQVVTLTPGQLKIAYKLFGLGFGKNYRLAEAGRLHVEPNYEKNDFLFKMLGTLSLIDPSEGGIKFTYGKKKIRFAQWLDDVEVSEILKQINSRKTVISN